ncbi:hypothetical protein Syun_016960 [Stephania yunnanensis]|uniref:WEB family protein n=1 Tax=Stephania yunnanensis TaxID=152371 RepID=A0AAP0J8A4_9MAGN
MTEGLVDSVTKSVVEVSSNGDERKVERKGRGEIDTSAPFESVKEAVSRFGGSAVWRPHKSLGLEVILCNGCQAIPMLCLVMLVLDFTLHGEVFICFSIILSKQGTGKWRNGLSEVEVKKLEEEAALLEKDLIVKERETLEVLKELEATKRNVEELKLKMQKDSSEVTTNPSSDLDEMKKDHIVEENEKQILENEGTENVVGSNEKIEGEFILCPSSSPGLILMELKQAKMNLSRTTDDIAGIRASVESLNKKISKERIYVKKTRERLMSNSAKISSLEEELSQTKHKLQIINNSEKKDGSENPFDITTELQQLSAEAERFKKMAEAAKSEVVKAMSEIERTKTSIRTAEIRWVAAKKMMEAARAAEAAALTDMKAIMKTESSSVVFLQRHDGVTLSFEEYSSLTNKACDSEERSKKQFLDAMLQIDEANVSKMDILKKVEEAAEEFRSSKQALEEALKRVDSANKGKLAVEEALRKWRSEHGQKRRSLHKSTKFKNSHPSLQRRDSRLLNVNGINLANEDLKLVLQPTLSIGQILSRKLLMPDEFEVGVLLENNTERTKVSLGQMLGKTSEVRSPPTTSENEANNKKPLPSKRKKFSFTRMSILLAKQNKKKKHATMPRPVGAGGVRAGGVSRNMASCD